MLDERLMVSPSPGGSKGGITCGIAIHVVDG